MSPKQILPPPLKKSQLLKLKLKALLSKLPKVNVGNIASVLLLMGMIGFIAVEAPQMHAKFLRAHVGSKVYKIQGNLNGGGGTGFAVEAASGTSYIVTNAHVCEGVAEQSALKGSVLVTGQDGTMPRRVLEISGDTDLCIIEGLPGVSGLALGNEPSIGEIIAVVGHPRLRPLTLSRGEIIAVESVTIVDHVMKSGDEAIDDAIGAKEGSCDLPKQSITEKTAMLMSLNGITIVNIKVCLVTIKGTYASNATIFPGNSGSPAVDFFGRVIGVAFASNDETHYGNIVSLSDLERFLSKY